MIFILFLLLCVLIGIVSFLPFFLYPNEEITQSFLYSDKTLLAQAKSQIAKQFLIDEKSFSEKLITEKEWATRKEFLEDRFIDFSKRLDQLEL